MDFDRVALAPFDRDRIEYGRREASALRRALGNLASSVDHIGGTALRFVPATPTLDFLVTCPTAAALSEASTVLSSDGYIPASVCSFPGGFDLSEGDILLFRSAEDGKTPTHSVRLTLSGSPTHENCLSLRAYLFGRPDVSREYAALKDKLAADHPGDRAAYERGKSEWIKNALPIARHWSRLGKTVTVTVDRPMGSVHPDRPDLVYPINCGYPRDLSIPGEGRLGVYILGVSHPVTTFTGRVIALLFRENGEGVRWVVAPQGREYDQARIYSEVWFRERDFRSTMEHLYHRSVGMVVYRNTASGYRYLLLRESRSQGWSIPKGHMEYGETELATAIREVREETGLDCTPPSRVFGARSPIPSPRSTRKRWSPFSLRPTAIRPFSPRRSAAIAGSLRTRRTGCSAAAASSISSTPQPASSKTRSETNLRRKAGVFVFPS